MAKCAITGRKTTFGRNVSHSHRKSSRTFKPNLKRIRVEENGTHKHIYISARALRSAMKTGTITRAS